MTITVSVTIMTARAHETVTSVAIAWIKTGMKRANHSRVWHVEEMQFITSATSVNRSFLNLFEVAVRNIVVERNLVFGTGNTRCTIYDIAFKA